MIASRVRTFVRRILTRQLISKLKFEDAIAVTPVSEVFGLDRGTPLDRVFINRFLEENRGVIRGDCLEVEEPAYTRKFGQPGHVAHALKFTATVDGGGLNEVVADLTRPETVPEARFDTFICTQTFNFIFNLDPAIESVHKLLRPGGHALITVAGISQISRYDYERWGDYWRFTDLSLGKLLSRKFSPADCSLTTFGNVATSCLFLQGVSVEDIPDKSILNITDPNYQMIVCALVKKSE
jgi:SAM-dependent methyltransferase